jgi:archaellum component FlaC
MLINSVKPITTTTLDEEFDDMEKELYTPEEAYEMTMKDIKAIYGDATV